MVDFPCVEIEILELVRLSAEGKKIIVDTNIPVDVLREISDYSHVVGRPAMVIIAVFLISFICR